MNQVKTVALLGLLSGLLIAISYSVLGGATGAIAGIILAAITNLGAWYFSDRIALAAYRAQPISVQQAPALHNMVAKLAQRAEIPKPAIYVIPGAAANAFATGRDPNHAAIAVTEGIMSLLPADELAGVIAHESRYADSSRRGDHCRGHLIPSANAELRDVVWGCLSR